MAHFLAFALALDLALGWAFIAVRAAGFFEGPASEVPGSPPGSSSGGSSSLKRAIISSCVKTGRSSLGLRIKATCLQVIVPSLLGFSILVLFRIHQRQMILCTGARTVHSLFEPARTKDCMTGVQAQKLVPFALGRALGHKGTAVNQEKLRTEDCIQC